MTTDADDPRWPELPWYDLIERISHVVFRVHADANLGTGFVFSLGVKKESGQHVAFFVTALHVVKAALQANAPIELVSEDGKRRFSSSNGDLEIWPIGDLSHDTALIGITANEPIVSKERLRPILVPEHHALRGAEVGWVGFPGIFEPELCFFHGHVSGYRGDPPAYLADGVAMGGVSGGPAFNSHGIIIGFVSAYIPNQVNSLTTLPGVSALIPIQHLGKLMVDLGATMLL